MTTKYTKLIHAITVEAERAFPDGLPVHLNETIEAAIVCLAHNKYKAVQYLLDWCNDYLELV